MGNEASSINCGGHGITCSCCRPDVDKKSSDKDDATEARRAVNSSKEGSPQAKESEANDRSETIQVIDLISSDDGDDKNVGETPTPSLNTSQLRMETESHAYSGQGAAVQPHDFSHEDYQFSQNLLTELKSPSHLSCSEPFLHAFSPNENRNYHRIIKKPIDISTISSRLDTNQYSDIKDFEADFRLLFSNCFAAFSQADAIHWAGKDFERLFEQEWAKRPQTLSSLKNGKPKKTAKTKRKNCEPCSGVKRRAKRQKKFDLSDIIGQDDPPRLARRRLEDGVEVPIESAEAEAFARAEEEAEAEKRRLDQWWAESDDEEAFEANIQLSLKDCFHPGNSLTDPWSLASRMFGEEALGTASERKRDGDPDLGPVAKRVRFGAEAGSNSAVSTVLKTVIPPSGDAVEKSVKGSTGQAKLSKQRNEKKMVLTEQAVSTTSRPGAEPTVRILGQEVHLTIWTSPQPEGHFAPARYSIRFPLGALRAQAPILYQIINLIGHHQPTSASHRLLSIILQDIPPSALELFRENIVKQKSGTSSEKVEEDVNMEMEAEAEEADGVGFRAGREASLGLYMLSKRLRMDELRRTAFRSFKYTFRGIFGAILARRMRELIFRTLNAQDGLRTWLEEKEEDERKN